MTPIVILNLIVSIVAIAGLTALMRHAYVAAHGGLADSHRQFEPADELERAA